jgi:ubiquinone/menaquinone biosynthesis C-methylase UbiE
MTGLSVIDSQGASIEENATADSWFVRRVMKLTPFEKWMIDRQGRISQTQAAAMQVWEQISLPPDAHCLEIGCGQGVMTRFLVDRLGRPLVATDFDPDQVAAAKIRLRDLERRVDFRVVDARDMPFADACFDAVFSFGVLHHLIRGWRRALSEASRTLKPKGWFVCTDLLAPKWLESLCGLLLRRVDLLGEVRLLGSLDENGLHPVFFATSGAPMAGLMRHCSFAAQKR